MSELRNTSAEQMAALDRVEHDRAAVEGEVRAPTILASGARTANGGRPLTPAELRANLERLERGA